MVRHRTRARVAQLLLGVLLFAQAALALADCDWLRAAPALAISASSSQPPCHEEPAVNANHVRLHPREQGSRLICGKIEFAIISQSCFLNTQTYVKGKQSNLFWVVSEFRGC